MTWREVMVWFMCLYHQLISVMVTTVVTSPDPVGDTIVINPTIPPPSSLSQPQTSSNVNSRSDHQLAMCLVPSQVEPNMWLVWIVHTHDRLQARIWRNSVSWSEWWFGAVTLAGLSVATRSLSPRRTPITILSGHCQTNSNTISTNCCQLAIINWTTIISPLNRGRQEPQSNKNVNKGFVLQICQENIIYSEKEMSNVSSRKQSS